MITICENRNSTMGSGISVGSTEVLLQGVNLATIRVWSRRKTDWLLLKTHLTSEQYLVYSGLISHEMHLATIKGEFLLLD